MADDKPVESVEEPPIQKVKVVDEEARRAKEKELSDDAAKYVVQEATPSSGGVFPPSAVVEPFSPEVVAAHTPGDEGREKLRLEQEKAEEKPAEPAAETTPG